MPKNRDALFCWNKETGGGDGTLASFYKYASCSWLASVFCLDSEFKFLHASCSEGKVPNYLNAEGGWEVEKDNGNQEWTKEQRKQ